MIPYTYNWIDMGGVDLADVMGKTYSGLYQRVIDGLNEALVAVFFNWYFSGIRIVPSHLKAVLETNKVRISGFIIINSDDTINIPTMSTAPVIEELNITENGNYSVPAGVDGYSPVSVNVPDIPAVVESLSVTENGTYTAPSGVDGYSPISVNVPDIPAVVESLSVTENGTYTAPSGVDGYSPVVVNIPSAAPTPVTPLHFETINGYVSGNYWEPDSYGYARNDVYLMQSGHIYVLTLGAVVGNRFRCLRTSFDTATRNVSSMGQTLTNVDNPAVNAYYNGLITYNSAYPYLTITKCNNNVDNLKTYLWDLTALGMLPPTT